MASSIIAAVNYPAFCKATLQDVIPIHELEQRCYASEDVFSPRRLRTLLKSNTCIALVVHGPDNRVTANVLGLVRHYSRNPSGRIYKISVDPSMRGLGLATHLLGIMEDSFRAAGMKRSCAEVRCSNKASRTLFEKSGYHVETSLPTYYPDGEDGIKYWKTL
ncbi:MAG: GNAT family N-acetyltransferase [Candidatus Riflebacteria bacterium]|nr:GNAT family N-acetyltransferase [Candidatus Riflebacteria bacterium]